MSEHDRLVASFRLPIPCSALLDLNSVVERLYGPGCVCKMEPPGWLSILRPVDYGEPWPTECKGEGDD